MSLEIKILASLISSRENFNLIRSSLDGLGLDPFSMMVLKEIVEFYNQSSEIVSIDIACLQEICSKKYQNDIITTILEKVKEVGDPTKDVRPLLYECKKEALRNALMSAIMDHREADIIKGCQEYLQAGVASFQAPKIVDIASEVEKIVSDTSELKRIKLAPASINRHIDMGVPQDTSCNILVFARPGTGKSAYCISLAYTFCSQGKKVVYIDNEQGRDTFLSRVLCRFVSTKEAPIVWSKYRQDEKRYTELARRNNLDLFRYYEPSNNTLGEIEAIVQEEKPDVLIVDQMLNLVINKESNSTKSLGEASRAIRALGKRDHMITVCATQAGKSLRKDADRFLRKEDVYMSSTEVPGAFSLMIGIGQNEMEDRDQGRIYVNIVKNQLGSTLTVFPAKIYPFSSMVVSS